MAFGGACPYCGKINDGFTGLTGAWAPKDGDACICVGCGNVAIFDAAGGFRMPTPEEQADLDADAGVQRARTAVLAAILSDKMRGLG